MVMKNLRALLASAAVACDDVDLAHLGKCPIDDLPNGFAIGYVQRRHPKTVAISRPKVVKGAFLAKGYRLIIPHPMSAEAALGLCGWPSENPSQNWKRRQEL